MIGIAAVLAAVNLAAFVMMGIDKRRAVRGRWRIPERTLLTVCALFGAAGGLMGMRLFRHKTQKARFRFGVPVMLIIQLALAGAAWMYAAGMI